MKQRAVYAVMAAGAGTGVLAAFLQTLEKLTLIKNKDAMLTCNINSVFSCSNVLNSSQSSVFGFPNSIMYLVLFTIFASVALVGLSGGSIPVRLRLSIQALSLLTLGFALWFLGESIYVIHALCIFCIFCFTGLLMVNGAWLRLNAASMPIGSPRRRTLERLIESGSDIFGWCLLATGLAFAIILRFR